MKISDTFKLRLTGSQHPANNFKIFCLLLSLCIFFTGCSLLTGNKIMNLNKSNNGQTINVSSGENITINLKGNATTGYTWTLSEYNKNLIQFVDVKYVQNNPKLAGSGGTWVTNFKILKPGKSDIKFIYKRPWEKEKEPLENFYIMINAKK